MVSVLQWGICVGKGLFGVVTWGRVIIASALCLGGYIRVGVACFFDINWDRFHNIGCQPYMPMRRVSSQVKYNYYYTIRNRVSYTSIIIDS